MAQRGHGALLRDIHGERFVDELLPRDVVSRAILARMLADGSEHVWLDATGLDHFAERFPTIHTDLALVGLDPSSDWLPVAPAAHHQCGGVVSDLRGATTLPGLWAAGEVACTGVNGANRLASNSLLEGMVFGPRAVESIAAGEDGPEATGAMRSVLGFPDGPPGPDSLDIPGVVLDVDLPDVAAVVSGATGASSDRDADRPAVEAATLRAELQLMMSTHAGVTRSPSGLAAARRTLEDLAVRLRRAGPADLPEVAEVRNLLTAGAALVAAAAARRESRGTHARSDHPEPEVDQRHRLVVVGSTPDPHADRPVEEHE